jgi:hypothetical protein
LIVETQHTRRAVEPFALEVVQQVVDARHPLSLQPPDGVANSNDFGVRPAGERNF